MKQTKLDSFEHNRIEDRAFWHYKRQVSQGFQVSPWRDYWKVNKKTWLNSAMKFKELLNEKNFTRYLQDPECCPWTLWNIQSMNGGN